MLHDRFRSPMERIPVREGDRVPVEISVEQRILIEEHTLVEPELLGLLAGGGEEGSEASTMLSLDDLEVLLGFVAFEANHTDDRRLRKRLDELFAYLQGVLDSYEDIYED